MKQNKAALLILDGWGLGNLDNTDAIFSANTKTFDSLIKSNPNCKLRTDGLFVGLPDNQMGNSEVGHLNIGAGRVVFQDLVKINQAVENNTIIELDAIKTILKLIQENPDRRLHLIGLVSDGGIHSHISHLFGLIDIFESTSNSVFIHGFTDGRDTDPNGGKNYFNDLENYIQSKSNINVATVIGRYYAMDRDNRWERIKKAYDLLVHNQGEQYSSTEEVFNYNYKNNITDEFIKPASIRIHEDSRIKEDDIVLCFNYRTDRCREISIALTQKPIPEQNMKPMNISYFTMTRYDESFKNVSVLFDKGNLKNTLGEVLANNSKTQLRIAETEKYPHVTFFFSGGQEKPFVGETRLMAQSPKVATYDLQPEMSAHEIKDKTINHISENNGSDFICLNFANPDMVGHTGVFEAVKKAVETVDNCLEELVPALIEKDYEIIIIADHGNAEKMVNPDGSCHTAHTTNEVPCILLNSSYDTIKDGKLADIAPTILKIMGINQPEEMNGVSLV